MVKYFIFRNIQHKILDGKYLIFSFMDVNSIEELKGLSEFNELTGLDLMRNNIKEIKNLENFSYLIQLNLCDNKIKRISGLENLFSLKFLDLSSNQIEQIENLDNLEKIEDLSLSLNGIKKIENLDSLRNLKELDLSYNKISKIENLENLINLEKLFLSGNTGINKIENLNNLKKLKIIGLKDVSLKRIEGLKELKNLEHLTIWVNENKSGISEIEGLEKLESLKWVDISSFNFNRHEVSSKIYVNILRFACMVKTNNYKSISDWKEIFINFPNSFDTFKWANSEFKVQWFIQQCSPNLLNVLSLILENTEFKKIRKKQEKEWNVIFAYAKEVLAPDFPKRTLNEVLKMENQLKKYDVEL